MLDNYSLLVDASNAILRNMLGVIRILDIVRRKYRVYAAHCVSRETQVADRA